MATIQELTRGARGVYDSHSLPLDPASFDWQSPFRIRGLWRLRPQPINAANRALRDGAIRLLSGSGLAGHIEAMMASTRRDQRERGAVILPGGDLGGIIRGHRQSVDFHARPGVTVVGDVHTHPPSPSISPPSYPEDFRSRNGIILVAESANGRVWQAFGRRYTMLLGRIRTRGHFETLDRTSPHFELIFGMS